MPRRRHSAQVDPRPSYPAMRDEKPIDVRVDPQLGLLMRTQTFARQGSLVRIRRQPAHGSAPAASA